VKARKGPRSRRAAITRAQRELERAVERLGKAISSNVNDYAAQYSAECRKYGRQAIYTKIGMLREDDPFYPVYIQFERLRAAESSREFRICTPPGIGAAS